MPRFPIRWRVQAGVLTLHESSPLLLRLFGLPFLAVGAWFAWNLVHGLVSADLTIAGLVLLPVMGGAFLFPGLVLSFGSRTSLVDGARRELVQVRSFGAFRLRSTRTIPSGARVVVSLVVRRTRRGQGYVAREWCLVELAGAPAQRLELAELDERDQDVALALARDVASLLQAYVSDARHAGAADAAGEDDAEQAAVAEDGGR